MIIAEPATTSTGAILTQLSLTPDNKLLLSATTRLLAEQNPAQITGLKALIFRLIKSGNVNLLTPYLENTILVELLRYYHRTHVGDVLGVSLMRFYAIRQFTDLCEALFKQRWPQGLCVEFAYFQSDLEPEYSILSGAVEIQLTCKNLAEAALATYMLETVLDENYNIRFRSAAKCLPVMFNKIEGMDDKIQVRICYLPLDFQKINGPLKLAIQDTLLMKMYVNLKNDYYDYCQLKYKIAGSSPSSVSAIGGPHLPDIMAAAYRAISEPRRKHLHDFSAKLLIVTRTGLGSGNFMNARTTIEGLCTILPQLKIDWIVANDGDQLPTTTKLPTQVSLYETDSLWKVYPLIRSLSIDADAVVNLPNAFLIMAEKDLLNTPLILSEQCIPMIITEYNASYKSGTIPEQYLDLRSGINGGDRSLGLLKPMILDIPRTLDEKRQLLCEDEKAAYLFRHNPTAPLYMGYAYQPRKEVTNSIVQGLKPIDILALFIQHAKYSKHRHIKVVLPIDAGTIQEAIKVYPKIIAGCTICYTHSSNIGESPEKNEIGPEAELYIEIFHLFPFSNTTFRMLMDYSAAYNVPVVTTGDQSFMELFFTMTRGFVFLYQVMEHKKELLVEIKAIATAENLTVLQQLIAKTEYGVGSEDELISLVDFINSREVDLKDETMKLLAVINAQPSLVDSFAQVIVASVMQKRLTLSPTMAAAAAPEGINSRP